MPCLCAFFKPNKIDHLHLLVTTTDRSFTSLPLKYLVCIHSWGRLYSVRYVYLRHTKSNDHMRATKHFVSAKHVLRCRIMNLSFAKYMYDLVSIKALKKNLGDVITLLYHITFVRVSTCEWLLKYVLLSVVQLSDSPIRQCCLSLSWCFTSMFQCYGRR